ncbi:MAG: sigma-70 family RNA polymerase sigma factor [Clostridia bacterium]|nr:sigma-70 family RNA polymerase sigma factor [Clostridia bacterium]
MRNGIGDYKKAMTAKEFFERGKLLSEEIRALTEAMSIAYAEATKTVSAPTSAAVKSSSLQNKRENAAIKYMELKAVITARLAELFKIKKEIFDFIEKIDDAKCRTVLINRYINGYTFEKIAETMYMNERWVYRIHKKALEICDEKLKER